MCEQGKTTEIVKLFHKNNKGFQFVSVDRCIAPIIQALNHAGLQTHASCCGHGKQPGRISLNDGREVFIMPDYESSQKVSSQFPPINPI